MWRKHWHKIILIPGLLLLGLSAALFGCEKPGSREPKVLSGSFHEQLVLTEDTVLENVTVTFGGPCVRAAESVTVTLRGENHLTCTGTGKKAFLAEKDLTLEGPGSLTVDSKDSCIKAKGNLKVDGGTFVLNAGGKGDGLRSDGLLTVNGGSLQIRAYEGLEAEEIRVNDGELSIVTYDDAMNAAVKSGTTGIPKIIVTGGKLQIDTKSLGKTDEEMKRFVAGGAAFDSNGELRTSGGVIEAEVRHFFADLQTDGLFLIKGGDIRTNGTCIQAVPLDADERIVPGLYDDRTEDVKEQEFTFTDGILDTEPEEESWVLRYDISDYLDESGVERILSGLGSGEEMKLGEYLNMPETLEVPYGKYIEMEGKCGNALIRIKTLSDRSANLSECCMHWFSLSAAGPEDAASFLRNLPEIKGEASLEYPLGSRTVREYRSEKDEYRILEYEGETLVSFTAVLNPGNRKAFFDR